MLKKFTIYSTPNCHYCHLLKSWLTEQGVPFENKDVAVDLEARKYIVEKSQQMGVPVSILEFDDGREELIIGFDQPRIAGLIGV